MSPIQWMVKKMVISVSIWSQYLPRLDIGMSMFLFNWIQIARASIFNVCSLSCLKEMRFRCGPDFHGEPSGSLSLTRQVWNIQITPEHFKVEKLTWMMWPANPCSTIMSPLEGSIGKHLLGVFFCLCWEICPGARGYCLLMSMFDIVCIIGFFLFTDFLWQIFANNVDIQ